MIVCAYSKHRGGITAAHVVQSHGHSVQTGLQMAHHEIDESGLAHITTGP